MYTSSIHLGRGMNIIDRTVTPILIGSNNRAGHFWCFATTRMGKTRLAEHMIEQDIRSCFNVVFIDPKGDIEILQKIVQIAAETGRLDDLIVVDPFYPDISATINPLSHYYMAEELVGHIVSGVEAGREPFFYNVAYEVALIVVQAQILLASNAGQYQADVTFEEIKNIISRFDLEALKLRIDSIAGREAAQLSRDMQKILDSPQDYYSKVSSSLRVALTELSQGNIGRVIGIQRHNRFLERIERKQGVIMVVRLASLATRKAAYTLGKVIVSMIQSLVGRTFLSGQKLDPALCLYIDEAQSILYHGIDDLFAKAGGANCWINGFCQSYNQIIAVLGKDRANSILDNINTKAFMRVPDPDTATYALSHFGDVRRYSPILGSDGNFSVREATEKLLDTNHFMQLQPRQLYFTGYNGLYKGITAPVAESQLQIILPQHNEGAVA